MLPTSQYCCLPVSIAAWIHSLFNFKITEMKRKALYIKVAFPRYWQVWVFSFQKSERSLCALSLLQTTELCAWQKSKYEVIQCAYLQANKLSGFVPVHHFCVWSTLSPVTRGEEKKKKFVFQTETGLKSNFPQVVASFLDGGRHVTQI